MCANLKSKLKHVRINAKPFLPYQLACSTPDISTGATFHVPAELFSALDAPPNLPVPPIVEERIDCDEATARRSSLFRDSALYRSLHRRSLIVKSPFDLSSFTFRRDSLHRWIIDISWFHLWYILVTRGDVCSRRVNDI